MTHTAACHIRSPAYRHRMTTPVPSTSAAEMVTVKTHHLLSMRLPKAGISCHPTVKARRVLRRSQRARNRHFSHTPAASMATAPHLQISEMRHPVNLRPMLITSCQRSLAFRKIRGTKNAASPDTIGSGKHRVSSRAASTHSSADGAARLYSVILFSLSGPARAVSSPARAGGLPGPADSSRTTRSAMCAPSGSSSGAVW